MVGHIFAAEVGVYFFNYYYLLRWVCMVSHFFAAEVGVYGLPMIKRQRRTLIHIANHFDASECGEYFW